MSDDKMDPKNAFDNMCPRKKRLFDAYVSALRMEIVSFGLFEPDGDFRDTVDDMAKEMGSNVEIPRNFDPFPIVQVRCFDGSLYPIPFNEIEEVASFTLLTSRNIKVNERLREALAEYRKFEN